ncbi:hypothetical protein ABPG77_006114 [Micractinium sp. CCAP 211/92]
MPCPVYTIQPGDTLEIIGQRFGFTAAQMEAALEVCVHGWTPGTFLQPGQLICLPGWVPACENVLLASRCPTCPGIKTCKFYSGMPGDTLESIAEALSIPMAALLAANPPLRLDSVLPIGYEVHLPPWGLECPKRVRQQRHGARSRGSISSRVCASRGASGAAKAPSAARAWRACSS